MRLLLDTHVFIWSVTGASRLKPAARKRIETAREVYVSSASIWEIAIKSRLGKIEGDLDMLVGAIGASGFLELPVTAQHAAATSRLALHHADPFDRLLLAQAQVEPLRLLTTDRALIRYGDFVEPLGG
ncbi:MAG: type II toxin-antitoxin system VapC family toxin [Steroidobacteraceae bacterium]